MQRLEERIFSLINPSVVAAYRILFGAAMFFDTYAHWHAWSHLDLHVWEYRPYFQWMSFLDGWSTPDFRVVCPIMMIALAMLCVGLMTRLSAFVFGCVHTYTEVLDPSRFNNHTYLIAVVAFWLVIVRSNAIWSVDSLIWRRQERRIPWWHQGVFQAQWCIVYFYGGLAKINFDWLRGEPIGAWVGLESGVPVIGPLMAHPWAGYFFGYGGLVFDLSVPFLLLNRKTRWIGFTLATMFHLTNTQLFAIGIFPWLAIASLVLFLEPETPERLVRRLMRKSEVGAPLSGNGNPHASGSRVIVALLAIYFLIQLTVPFRHHLYAGYVEWTEVGKAFSWRMMLSHRETFVGMNVIDADSGRSYEVDQGGVFLDQLGKERGERAIGVVEGRAYLVPKKLIRKTQLRPKGVWGNVRLLGQYAHYVAKEAKELGIRNPVVRVDVVSSLNGRPFQYLIDPNINLVAEPLPLFGTPEWVIPLAQNQPIGDYPADADEYQMRVMEVIQGHRLWLQRQQELRRASGSAGRVDGAEMGTPDPQI